MWIDQKPYFQHDFAADPGVDGPEDAAEEPGHGSAVRIPDFPCLVQLCLKQTNSQRAASISASIIFTARRTPCIYGASQLPAMAENAVYTYDLHGGHQVHEAAAGDADSSPNHLLGIVGGHGQWAEEDEEGHLDDEREHPKHVAREVLGVDEHEDVEVVALEDHGGDVDGEEEAVRRRGAVDQPHEAAGQNDHVHERILPPGLSSLPDSADRLATEIEPEKLLVSQVRFNPRQKLKVNC